MICNDCRFFHDPGVFRGTCSQCKFLFPSYVQENKPDMFSANDQDGDIRHIKMIMGSEYGHTMLDSEIDNN